MSLRKESYPNSNDIFTRTEIEGKLLTVTEAESTTHYRGKDVPTHTSRWVGVHWVQLGADQEPFLAAQSMIWDAGPKLGISVCFTRCPERPPTEEERAANRERMRKMFRDAFGVETFIGEDPVRYT